MKNTRKSLLAALAFGAMALSLSAQPAIKLMVVDMAGLFDSHYKTLEQNERLKGDEQKAQQELEKLNAEGNQLVEEYKKLIEDAKNPALTDDAKGQKEQVAQAKLQDIQNKQNEVGAFRNNTQRSLEQRLRTFRTLMLEEIGKVVAEVAKRKGATLVLDKSGPSLIGVSPLVYSDPAYEITADVMAEIEKSKPAGSATPAASTTAPAATGDSPKVTFPKAN